MRGCALHARGGVHGVAKDGELGQLGAYQARHARASVDADADGHRLAVVRHSYLQGKVDVHIDQPLEHPFLLRQAVMQSAGISFNSEAGGASVPPVLHPTRTYSLPHLL